MARNVEVELEEHTCATHRCGITFWLTPGFADRRRKDKRDFYCPNGHTLVYNGDTEEKKLRNLVDIKNQEIDRLNRELSAKKRRGRPRK